MIIDYLTLGGAEIINTMRADAYAGSGIDMDDCGGDAASGCGCDEDAGRWLNNNAEYKGIKSDPAPWYDPAAPESADVYGFTGLTVTGLDTGVYPIPGNGDESPTGATRDIEITLLVSARDDCGLSYALGWLAGAIAPGTCGDDCGGVHACFLACCPVIDPDTGEALNNPIRNVLDVTVVEGPSVEEVFTDGSEVVAEVIFVLRTNNVGIYRPATDDTTWMITPATGTPVRVDMNQIYEECEDPPACGVDPVCSPPPPIPLPAPPIDDCYPRFPFDAYRERITIPSGVLISGFDTVPVIRVEAGPSSVRNLLIRFFHNPFDIECFRLPSLNPCRTCGDLIVPFIPANSRLVLDGRSERALLTCRSAQGTSKWIPTVYGRPGMTADWPTITCNTSTCIEVYTADTVSAEATITIELVARQEAG